MQQMRKDQRASAGDVLNLQEHVRTCEKASMSEENEFSKFHENHLGPFYIDVLRIPNKTNLRRKPQHTFPETVTWTHQAKIKYARKSPEVFCLFEFFLSVSEQLWHKNAMSRTSLDQLKQVSPAFSHYERQEIRMLWRINYKISGTYAESFKIDKRTDNSVAMT